MSTDLALTGTSSLAVTSATTPAAIVGIDGWLGTLSANTADAYRTDLMQYGAWLADLGIDWRTATPAVLTAFLADLASGVATGRPIGSASRQRKLSAILSYYRYARHEGLTSADPAPLHRPKHHRPPVIGLNPKDAAGLWAVTEGHARDRLLVALMMYGGLRLSEALGIELSDFRDELGERIVSVLGKGNKTRDVVLSAPLVVAINEWLVLRGTEPGRLLTTRTGRDIHPRSAERIIERLGRAAGVEGLFPHRLRHTAATTAVADGAHIVHVKDFLGHESITTTMVYLQGIDRIRNSPAHRIAAALTAAVA